MFCSRHLTPLMITAFMLTGCHQLDDDVDAGNVKNLGPAQQATMAPDELRQLMVNAGAAAPVPNHVPNMDEPKVKLGQALFFDKIVSGNQDISCGTCHHPVLGTSDALPTSIGVGGSQLGLDRAGHGEGFIIPRNSPDIFNRGLTEWRTMFWDARVSIAAGYFATPAGATLPAEIDSVLSAQAMFPPTSRHEMRGEMGENEIGDVEDSDLQGIWDGLIARILTVEEYVDMFAEAFPGVPTEDLGFEHAANAIAAFEVAAFTKLDTPYDRFLNGDNSALTSQERRGAELFFGEAGCAGCHTGALLTDQETHCIATPQLGPGKDKETADDVGRELETNSADDRYAFRTPPLRNVELTGPYMHSGAYATLEEVVRHHMHPEEALREYTGDELPSTHRDSVQSSNALHDEMVSYLSPNLGDCSEMGDDEVDALVAFLKAMTDPSARDMSDVVPFSVPSGFTID